MNGTKTHYLSLFQRASQRRPYILGHRGARRLIAENTIPSLHAALDEGADGVEIDVRMTCDGILAIAHDECVSPANQFPQRLIGRLTFSQLQEIYALKGLVLPTLRDVLRFQAETGARVNIELKGDVAGPSWMAHEAAKQIRSHGGGGIVVSSFSPQIVALMARKLPLVPCALLIEREQKCMRRLLPIGLLRASAVHLEEVLVDAALMKRVRQKCTIVNVWTVNDPERARQLSLLGVDAIITDEPRLLRGALDGMPPRTVASL